MLDMEDSIAKRIYRGWNFITNEWVYGYLLVRKDKYYIATSDALDFMALDHGKATLRLIEVEPQSIGIYTLHNDWNDIKVFTGDILESVVGPGSICSVNFRAVVLYDNDYGMYFASGSTSVDLKEFHFFRVIGNIYDHPELLDTVELGEEYTEDEWEENEYGEQEIRGIGHTTTGYFERWDGAIERFDSVVAREYVEGEKVQEDEENEDACNSQPMGE